MKYEFFALLIALSACGIAVAEPNEALPTFEESCFQTRPPGSFLSIDDAQRMLEGIGDNQITRADQNKVNIKGLFRVRDWKPDDVVRISVPQHGQALRIYIWGESEGVVIFLHPAGAAYRISQRPEELHSKQDFRAVIGALVATDDRRDFRLPAGAYQIRCVDKAVVVTKGDVRLMTVPLEVPAKSFYLQEPWGGTLYDLALGHAGAVPDDVPAHRVVLDGARPDQLSWREKLPADARFQELEDGGVELSADQSTEVAMASVASPEPGLYEVVVRIDDATAGTGIAFLDAKGEAIDGIGFELAQQKKLVFGYATPRESPRIGNEDIGRQPVTHAGPHQWLRLIVTAGAVRCWLSSDGRHWGQVLESHDRTGPWQSVAIFARESRGRKPEEPVRHIRLGYLQVRELDGLVAAAPVDLLAKAAAADVAVNYDKGETVEAWSRRIAAAAPAGASATAWRYACAVRALASTMRIDTAEAMLARAVRERVEELPTVAAKIRLLQDAALIWRPNSWASQQEMEIWNSVARELLSDCTPAECALFQQAYMQTSFADPQERTGPIAWDLARDAMFLYYGQHRSAEMARMVGMVIFWKANDPQVGGWPIGTQLDHLLSLLDVRPLHKAARKRRGSVDIAGAIAPPMNRAADAILSELQTALDAKQFPDAARILITSNPPRDRGLVPAFDDEQLFVSFSVALRMLIERHDGFREVMNRQIGPADQLKIEQCLGRGDPAAVEALTLQYDGTSVAAVPCQWLGDRALAAADFAQALHWYEEGLRTSASGQQSDLAARLRLASAMLGTVYGRPPTEAVLLNGQKIPPGRFEQCVQEQLALGRRAHAFDAAVDDAVVLPVSQPAKAANVPFSRWDENAGRGFRREDMPGEFYDVDWSWRHLTMRAEDDGLFVFHRSRIAAYDLAGGKMRWSCNLGNAWSPSRSRPLFTADRIYVSAALATERCGVACLDRKTGRRHWLADCDGAPVSDPLLAHGRLYVLAMGRTFRQPTAPLSLVELDTASGDVIARHPIADMTEHVSLPGQCEVARAGDRLIVLMAGNVFCTDFQGRMLWLRQSTPLSYQIDPSVPQQLLQPAIAADGNAYLQQPGSCVVECLDLETGERRWQRGIVGLRSISELQDDRLLARSEWGLVALSRKTGDVLWQRALSKMLTIDARTSSGLILVACQTMAGDRPQVEFRWLNGASGQWLARSSIPLAENRPVRFGPLVAHGGRAWAAIGYGPKDDSPAAENNKHIVELRLGEPIMGSEVW